MTMMIEMMNWNWTMNAHSELWDDSMMVWIERNEQIDIDPHTDDDLDRSNRDTGHCIAIERKQLVSSVDDEYYYYYYFDTDHRNVDDGNNRPFQHSHVIGGVMRMNNDDTSLSLDLVFVDVDPDRDRDSNFDVADGPVCWILFPFVVPSLDRPFYRLKMKLHLFLLLEDSVSLWKV